MSRLTRNEKVAGSIPAGGPTNSRGYPRCRGLGFIGAQVVGMLLALVIVIPVIKASQEKNHVRQAHSAVCVCP